jgi:4-amino-4-deoxy-L-arabinose transferase-like glycosyltransferase
MWTSIKAKIHGFSWPAYLWALILLSIAVHLFISFFDNPGFWTDSLIYLLQADYFSNSSPEYYSVLEQAISYRNFPPLYPYFLSVLGAGSDNIILASVATSLLLLPACLFYIDWQVKEGMALSIALINSILFLLLPSTLLFSTELWSENLYLFLVLFTLWSLQRLNSGDRKWIYISAFACGLAFITRTAGISLIIALLIVVYDRDKKHIVFSSIAIFVPYLIWAYISRGFEYNNEYLRHDLLERYENLFIAHGGSVNGIYEVVQTQLKTLWWGFQLQFNGSTNAATVVLVMLILVAACYSLSLRIFSLSPDALYVLFYLGIIFVWNYPDHNVRFMYVITPFILFYAQLTMESVFKESDKIIKTLTHVLFPVLISITILPSLILMAERVTVVPGEYHNNKSNDRLWLTGADTQKMYKQLIFKKRLIESIIATQEVVPKNECVYSTHQELVMLYSKRKVLVPPTQEVKRKDFINELMKCHYMFIVAASYGQQESMYPVDRVKNNSWVLSQTFFPVEQGGEIISVLLKLDKINSY